ATAILVLADGQPHREGCASIQTQAVSLDGAAMEFDDFPYYGESKPQTGPFRFVRVIFLPEAIKDEGQESGSDSFSGIGNGDLHGIAVSQHLQRNGSAARCEFDCIV